MKAQGFGYKNAWIAVKTEQPQAVADMLGLRDARAADWTAGLEAAYAYPSGGKVFVTPPIDGWVMAVGLPLFDLADTKPPSFGRRTAEWAARLQTDVRYFATHRVVEAHAWARAFPGGLERAFYYLGESGETVHDEGTPLDDERALNIAFTPSTEDDVVDDAAAQLPCEEHVMALAEKWSVDPTSLEARDLEKATASWASSPNGVRPRRRHPPPRERDRSRGGSSGEDIMIEPALRSWLAIPGRIDDALSGLPEAQLDLKAGDEHLSIREVVHHLVEANLLACTMIISALARNGGYFDWTWVWPNAGWMVRVGYSRAPIRSAQHLLRAMGPHVAALLAASPDAFDRKVELSDTPEGERYVRTVRDLLTEQVGHAEEHLHDVALARAAHRPKRKRPRVTKGTRSRTSPRTRR